MSSKSSVAYQTEPSVPFVARQQPTVPVEFVPAPQTPAIIAVLNTMQPPETIGLQVGVLTVTPPIAQMILDDQDTYPEIFRNRKIDRHRVMQYVNEILAKTWLMTGETLIFCGSFCMNGQHRLRAVIASGQPVQFLIVRGVGIEAFPKIDQNKIRTANDLMELAGIQYRTLVRPAARFVMMYEKTGSAYTREFRPTQSQIAAYAQDRRDAFEDAARLAYACKMGHTSILTVLAYLTRNHPLQPVFFAKLKEGIGLERDEPVRVLRERLIAHNSKSTRNKADTTEELLGYCIKAWNATLDGQVIQRFRAAPEGNYPVLNGATFG